MALVLTWQLLYLDDYFGLQAFLSSDPADGSSGLLCWRGRAYTMWSRGTREGGGLWALCSSTVSMDSMGSISADASLKHRQDKRHHLPTKSRKQRQQSNIRDVHNFFPFFVAVSDWKVLLKRILLSVYHKIWILSGLCINPDKKNLFSLIHLSWIIWKPLDHCLELKSLTFPQLLHSKTDQQTGSQTPPVCHSIWSCPSHRTPVN